APRSARRDRYAAVPPRPPPHAPATSGQGGMCTTNEDKAKVIVTRYLDEGLLKLHEKIGDQPCGSRHRICRNSLITRCRKRAARATKKNYDVGSNASRSERASLDRGDV